MADHNYLFSSLSHLFQLSIPREQNFFPVHLFVICNPMLWVLLCAIQIPLRTRLLCFSRDCCLLWAHSWVFFLELYTAEQSCPAQAFTIIQQLVTVNRQRPNLTNSVYSNSEGFPCPQSLCHQPSPHLQLHHSSDSVQLFCLALLSLFPRRNTWKPSPKMYYTQVSNSKSVSQRTKLKDIQIPE